ncbi:MAG: dipeptidase [Caldilineaceae bacterium]
MSSFPLIFDGHNDTLLDLFDPNRKHERSFFERSDKGHIDLPRAKAGGLGGGFFAIFIPNPPKKRKAQAPLKVGESSDYLLPLPPMLEHEYAVTYATRMVGCLRELERQSNGQLKVVSNADDIQNCLNNGVMAAILHFEGAEAIDADLHNLHAYYAAGLRSIGPVWSRPTIFANGVPFGFPHSPDTGDGLTDAGKRLVKECNQLGIMIDLSHMNEKGFWDVAAISTKPLVATHSNAHALAPSTRNLTDKQLDAVKESGGMVGLNYHIGFLRSDGRSDQQTTVDELVRHAGYIADRIGIEHLGLGSDFDGATMPQDMKDAAGLPLLMAALQAGGFDQSDLRKIAHENWLRVLRKTWS